MMYNEREQGDSLSCLRTLRVGNPSVRGYPLAFNFDHLQNSPDSSHEVAHSSRCPLADPRSQPLQKHCHIEVWRAQASEVSGKPGQAGENLTLQQFLHLATEIGIVIYKQELPDSGSSHVISANAV